MEIRPQEYFPRLDVQTQLSPGSCVGGTRCKHRGNWKKQPVKAASTRADSLQEGKLEASMESGQVRTAGLEQGGPALHTSGQKTMYSPE